MNDQGHGFRSGSPHTNYPRAPPFFEFDSCPKSEIALHTKRKREDESLGQGGQSEEVSEHQSVKDTLILNDKSNDNRGLLGFVFCMFPKRSVKSSLSKFSAFYVRLYLLNWKK